MASPEKPAPTTATFISLLKVKKKTITYCLAHVEKNYQIHFIDLKMKHKEVNSPLHEKDNVKPDELKTSFLIPLALLQKK